MSVRPNFPLTVRYRIWSHYYCLLYYCSCIAKQDVMRELHLNCIFSRATPVGDVVALCGETSRFQLQSGVLSYNVGMVYYANDNPDDRKKYGNIHAVFTNFDLKF